MKLQDKKLRKMQEQQMKQFQEQQRMLQEEQRKQQQLLQQYAAMQEQQRQQIRQQQETMSNLNLDYSRLSTLPYAKQQYTTLPAAQQLQAPTADPQAYATAYWNLFFQQYPYLYPMYAAAAQQVSQT